jgi:hypothetical protein
MSVQFVKEALTLYMVRFTLAEITCGSDLVARSGKEERVETHRSG